MTAASQNDPTVKAKSVVRVTIDEVLAPLKQINPAAYNLLMHANSTGFFDHLQSKYKTKSLAEQLFKTILIEGDSDEN